MTAIPQLGRCADSHLAFNINPVLPRRHAPPGGRAAPLVVEVLHKQPTTGRNLIVFLCLLGCSVVAADPRGQIGGGTDADWFTNLSMVAISIGKTPRPDGWLTPPDAFTYG